MQRERRRWQTRFGRFVARHKVAWIVRELEAAGQGVTPFAVYSWVRGATAPRPTFARTLVRISRGALSLNDIYGHREQLMQPPLDRGLLSPEAAQAREGACRST